MNRTDYSSASNFSSRESTSDARGRGVSHFGELSADELSAKRLVNAVATLRILVPVALITAIVMSGRIAPEAPVNSAMAAVAATAAAPDAATHYFPAQHVNQGVGGEEHVPSF